MTAITNGVATWHTHDDWRDQAACTTQDPDVFYPESTRAAAATPAKRACWPCPVRRDCLTWALDTDQEHGVWGGLTEKERGRLERVLRAGDVARAWELADELAEPTPDEPPEPEPERYPPGRQTECRRGHPLTAENAYFNGTHANGTQRLTCRRCHIARQRRRCVECDRYLKRGETAECATCEERRRARR